MSGPGWHGSDDSAHEHHDPGEGVSDEFLDEVAHRLGPAAEGDVAQFAHLG
jgi:hypothetical protein